MATWAMAEGNEGHFGYYGYPIPRRGVRCLRWGLDAGSAESDSRLQSRRLFSAEA